MERVRWEVVAPGRPYHAAYVPLDGSPPGVIQHDHVDYVELLGVLEGTGDHHVDGAGRSPLEPGTVALLRPGDVHAITGTLAFVNVAFPVATWRGFLATAGLPAWPAGRAAARCGSTSQAYFTRLFTARHGRPPAAFRSAARAAVAPNHIPGARP